jgi:hypothetical protein
LGVLEYQRNPVGFSRFPGQEFKGCLALALATFVATMGMGEHDQSEGLLGEVSCGALEGRSDAGMDQFDQRRRVHNGIQFLKNQRLQWWKRIVKKPFGNMHPLLALMRMVVFLLGRRLGGKMRMVPRQDPCLSDPLRDQIAQGDMERFALFKRDQAIVKRGAQGVQKFRHHRLSDLGDQAQQERQLCADAGDRTESTPGGAQG